MTLSNNNTNCHGKHPGPAPFIQSQPRLSRFTLRGLLSLPRRLCSPPAAVGKVRSFGLTPIFDVRLEDVLDRKHLPPLSLKDFEEWLLYVEQSVENLYFILWMREYTAKYDRWIAKVRAREAKSRQHQLQHQQGRGTSHNPAAAYRVAWSVTTPYSPALALFFSRARETFLVPGAPYELSLPPALLDALSVVNGHPDPAVLAPARAHVEDALRGSLARCVRAAYSNVGTYRAACGIAAGIFFLLVGTIPPLAVNFTRSQSRWERLVIVPGLFLGLTILIASLRGICMMIYIFGDFRQLRKFELVRPPPPTSIPVFESKPRSPASIAAPTRPVRALTAPPKIAIRIPTNTPSLSYGTTTSVSISTDTSFTGTNTQTSYTNTNATSHTHAHTISISSLKSRGGTSSLVFPHGQRSSHLYADSETRSVPAYASDDESFVDDEEGDEDGMSTASDHGIYISPAMPSPDMAAEDDPAVVNAALALIASEATNGSTGQVSLAGLPAAPVQSVATPGPSGTSAHAPAGPSTSTSSTPPKVQAPSQVPTAPFIPAYPYSDADSLRGRKHSHSRSRSVSNKIEEDLEAGETAAVQQPLGPFDFDALPIPPPPPTPAPAPPAPTASVVGSRPRAPEVFLDTSALTGFAADEKAQLTLPSPTSGYGLGVNTASGVGTEFGPVSPARSDDAARLCEKASGPSGEESGGSSSSRRRSSYSHVPFFVRLPRVVSLFRPRHHSHSHSQSSSSYNTFNDFSPYAHSKEYKSKGSLFEIRSEPSSRRGSISWRTRCALESRVPAFGPVTRVLAPVVARAQWEIVVRAACLAALLCFVACGVVVSLPVPGES